jgi:hypothetical protein
MLKKANRPPLPEKGFREAAAALRQAALGAGLEPGNSGKHGLAQVCPDTRLTRWLVGHPRKWFKTGIIKNALRWSLFHFVRGWAAENPLRKTVAAL